MTIDIIPTEVEGVEHGEGAFKLRAFDKACAELTVSTFVSLDSIDELFDAIKAALTMMRLPASSFEDQS